MYSYRRWLTQVKLNRCVTFTLIFIFINNFVFSLDFFNYKPQKLSSVSSSRVNNDSSVSFDYHIGGGFGFYQTSAIASPLSDIFDMAGWSSFHINNFYRANYSWTGGGFVGLGISFEASLPMAVGLEYKGEYLGSKKILGFDLVSQMGDSHSGKRVAHLSAYKHSLDLYYKITFVEGHFPIGLQLMAGFAMMNPLSSSLYEIESSNPHVNIDRFIYSIPTLGMGFHLGGRVHFHMIYLGLDYSYLGYFSQEGQMLSSSSFFARNTVNFSIGLILNKAVLKALMD